MNAGPRDLDAFIAARTRHLSLRDGSRLRVRPIHPDDKAALSAGFDRLSPASRYRRFFSGIDHLSPAMLAHVTEIDYDSHFAWVAIAEADPDQPGTAVARYVRDADQPDVAEPAVAVVDAYQGLGLGTLMLELLIATALEHGVRRFRASLLEDNRAMRHLFEVAGARFARESPGVLNAEFELPQPDRARLQLAYDLLRHFCEGSVARARRVLTGEGG